MGILSSIVSGITTIAETVVSSIAAAIAAPTVATVVGAVCTVGLVVGAGYLIYKAVDYVGTKADQYITNKCNPDDLPHRAPIKELEEENDRARSSYSESRSYDNISKNVCRNDEERTYKRFSLDDKYIPHIDNSRCDSRFNIDRDYAFRVLETFKDKDGREMSVLEPKKKKKKTKKLRKIAEIAKCNKKIHDFDNVGNDPEAYLDSLPWLNRNITCIC